MLDFRQEWVVCLTLLRRLSCIDKYCYILVIVDNLCISIYFIHIVDKLWITYCFAVNNKLLIIITITRQRRAIRVFCFTTL